MCDERGSADRPDAVPDADGRVLLHRTHHDMAGEEELSVSVVAAVTTVSGVEPMAADPPFYECFDPQSLDGLFRPKHDGTPRATRAYLVLEIHGYSTWSSCTATGTSACTDASRRPHRIEPVLTGQPRRARRKGESVRAERYRDCDDEKTDAFPSETSSGA